MKKTVILSLLALSGAVMAPQASAQKFALKAYGDIGLGKAMSLTTALPGMTAKSSSNAFGVDFGYTFWKMAGSSLEVNAGIGYRLASATFDIASLDYNYAAPAAADKNHSPYQRFTQLSDVHQKVDLGYLYVPIYLQYQYRCTSWLGVHADVGFGFGYRCSIKVGNTTGTAKNYGVYPGGDVVTSGLNDFGETDLTNAKTYKPGSRGLAVNVMCGAGLEFYVYGPLSVDLGVRYNAGLREVFVGRYDITNVAEMNADTAPVTYTASSGQQVRPLCTYVTKSRLNPLSLHVGVNVRF